MKYPCVHGVIKFCRVCEEKEDTENNMNNITINNSTGCCRLYSKQIKNLCKSIIDSHREDSSEPIVNLAYSTLLILEAIPSCERVELPVSIYEKLLLGKID